MTFRFLAPRSDGSVLDLSIEADDVHLAFDDFADNHWRADMEAQIGIWVSGTLVAKVARVHIGNLGEYRPMYRVIEPPPSEANRFACGD